MKNWKNLFGRNLGLLIAAAFFTLVDCIPLQAQNVTIRPSNGSTLASRPVGDTDYDTFFKLGGFATWKHNQLTLTLTTSDYGTLTANGQLANPANNIYADKSKDEIHIGKGNKYDGYVAICLPKGYRFTGYTIEFSRSVSKFGTGDGTTVTSGTATFGETNSSFAYRNTNDANVYRTRISYGNTRYTLSRTSMSEDDMDNVLYFKLQNSDDSRSVLVLHHVELQFTAESDYTPVTPAGNINGVSAVDIPFSTSKVDYGRLSNETYNGSTRMSYSSANVTDLEAYLTLFEDESTEEVSDNGYDGTPGKMVKYKSGTIYNEGDYFRLGREGKEQIYYLETPIYVTLPDAQKTKSPIGYRIVGAEFEYNYGEPRGEYETEVVVNPGKTYNTFYISATVMGGTYHLTSNGGATTSTSSRATWFIDEEGYIRNANNQNSYLRYTIDSDIWGTSYSLSTTTNKDNATKWSLSGNHITVDGTNLSIILEYSLSNSSFTLATSSSSFSPFAVPSPTGETITIGKQTETVTVPAFTPSPYKINIYSNKKKYGEEDTIIKTIEVNAENKKGKYFLGDLNNDAVKFSVEGIGLVKATLTLQALDPYIDRLDIVCQEQDGNGRKLTQQFNATDFSVRGGKFNFYVPADYEYPCRFTFEELYSKYGDNTYYNNTGSTSHSRYSFVWSPYFEYIGSNGKNVYYTNPDHTYTDKVKTDYAGLTEYKFNNAADFVDGGNGGIYTEYPFTPGLYGEDNFEPFIFSQEEMNSGKSKIAYLFTSDETRYNIAPTTATQHVYYAYYQMEISMQKRTYQPKLEWTKIYDDGKTLYMDNNGGPATDSQWGLKLSTSDAGDQGEIGYLSVSQVVDGINNAINKEGAPKAKDQILYVDGSKLLSLVEDQTHDGVTHTLNQIQEGLGKNVIVYLPKGVSAKYDNFAMNTDAGFRGAGNFVITDRKPFYAPYDIKIDAANTCKYTRNVTKDEYGKIAAGTIILPFEILVEDGIHENSNSKFSLHTMQKDNCLKDEVGSLTYVYFPALAGVDKTKANTPYLVNVLSMSSEDDVVFVVSQKGTTIEATTGMDNNEYTFKGEDASGSREGKSYNFHARGCYSGKQLAKGGGYFYYSRHGFVCSDDLDDRFTSAKLLPFRTYYTTDGTQANLMSTFGVIYGEGEGNTDPTGISNVDENPDLIIASGVGTITMASTIEQGVKIYNMNGVLVNKVMIGAGETKTVNLPAGMYIVNGAKLIVR